MVKMDCLHLSSLNLKIKRILQMEAGVEIIQAECMRLPVKLTEQFGLNRYKKWCL